MTKKLTIAIDGYSSCGKSTLAKAIAQEYGYIFIDTGAMYRAVTLFAMRKGFVSPTHTHSKEIIQALGEIELGFELNPTSSRLEILLNGENVENEIRRMEVSALVSNVSPIKEVREKLVAEQRKMGEKGGVVMDGRDIGSVVFPFADLKLFVTAHPEIRAQRRFKELQSKGDTTSTLAEVSENLKYRDEEDSNRKESPLIQTEDAIVLDNSHLNQEEQFDFVKKIIENILAKQTK
jgi:cytidylate kinase